MQLIGSHPSQGKKPINWWFCSTQMKKKNLKWNWMKLDHLSKLEAKIPTKTSIATSHHMAKYQLRLRVFSLALSTVGHIMVKIFEAPAYLHLPPSTKKKFKKIICASQVQTGNCCNSMITSDRTSAAADNSSTVRLVASSAHSSKQVMPMTWHACSWRDLIKEHVVGNPASILKSGRFTKAFQVAKVPRANGPRSTMLVWRSPRFWSTWSATTHNTK